MSDTNDGLLAAGADDHVGNPPFYYHFNEVLKRVEEVSDDRTRDALLDGFLFLYMSVLDLYRKLSYIYRADAEHLSSDTPFSQDDLEFLRTIATNHEDVEQSKAQAQEEADEAGDQDNGKRQKVAVVEVLEKQVHALWAGHQEAWHDSMQEITDIQLTRPDVDRPDYQLQTIQSDRRELRIFGGM